MIENLVKNMLKRGDYVAIINGRLTVRLSSGNEFSKQSHEEYFNIVQTEIINEMEIPAFQYQSYSVGHYGDRKAPGLTLHYINLLNFDQAYIVFNAELTRKRISKHGKKGEPLPAGEFRVGGVRHSFVKHWRKLKLKLPPNNVFHCRMGQQKKLLVTGSIGLKNRINKDSIKLLNITHHQLMQTFLPNTKPDNDYGENADNKRIKGGVVADKTRIKITDKKTQLEQSHQGIEANLSTCNDNCVQSTANKVNTYNVPYSNVIPLVVDPKEQTIEEWLDDLGEL